MTTATDRKALEIARQLVKAGMPVFRASPVLDAAGKWLPDANDGTRGIVNGYHLPSAWQLTEPDPAVLDAYQHGDALGMVTGRGLDVADVDPRNGGDVAALDGAMPRVYGEAATPSGGEHYLIASLGVRKGKAAAGIDVQAGNREGKGRGFVFIAPTRKASKVDGKVHPYAWTHPPDFAEIERLELAGDDSGAALAKLVETRRNGGSSGGGGGTDVDIFADELDGANVYLLGAPDATIPLGIRDDWTFTWANWLRTNDVPLQRALELIDRVSFERPNDPDNPWTPRMARHKVRRTYHTYSRPEADGEGAEFAWYSAADLAVPPPPVRFLVKGVVAEGTYAPVAGPKKTLKSYTLDDLGLSVASGEPFLGYFEVVRPGPVLSFVSEGGRALYQRRRHRLAEEKGITVAELAGLPIITTFTVHDIDSAAFRDELARKLDEVQPALVTIDSLYGYHPAAVEVSNVYERGAMLTRLSDLVGGQAALYIADHFRKTGTVRLDLDNIAQAGMGPWADSWIVQKHRKTPRPDIGEFRLRAEFGSREWGSTQWEIDWHLGLFDHELGSFTESLGMEVAPAGWDEGAEDDPAERTRAAALRIVDDADPFTLTESALVKEIGGKAATARAAVAELVENGTLVAEFRAATEGRRTVTRERIGRPE
jgi:hypothetical protein